MVSTTSSRKVSYFVKVDCDNVVQMELHILTKEGENKDWMQRRHCQEIEMLLLDVIKKHVSEELKKRQQTKKWRKRWPQSGEKSGSSSEAFTQPQILTGESLRMAYSFKKKSLPHYHLLTDHSDTGYRGLHLFSEKLVVYVYHLEGYNSYQQNLENKVQSMADSQLPKTSSYFTADGKQVTDPQHHNVLKNIIRNNLEVRKHCRKRKAGQNTEKRGDVLLLKATSCSSADQNNELLIQDQENAEPKHKIKRCCLDEDEGFVVDGPLKTNEEAQEDPDADVIAEVNVEQKGQLSSSPLKRKQSDLFDLEECVNNDKADKYKKVQVEHMEDAQLNRRTNIISIKLDSISESDKQKPSHSEVSTAVSSSDVTDFGDDDHKTIAMMNFARCSRHGQKKPKKKKVKLIEKFLDDFSTSSIDDEGDSDDETAGEEPPSTHQRSSLLLLDRAKVYDTQKSKDSAVGEVLDTQGDRLMRNNFRFRRLKLKRTKLPLFDDSIHLTTSDLSSENGNKSLNKFDAQREPNIDKCFSTGHLNSKSSSYKSYNNTAKPSDIHVSSTVDTEGDRVLSDTVSSDEDLPSLLSSVIRSDTSNSKIQTQAGGMVMSQDVSAGDVPEKPVVIEENDDDRIIEEIEEIRHVSNLSKDHLAYIIRTNEGYLRDILKSKINSRRHEDYKSGLRQRVNLKWQIPLGLFTDPQIDSILQILLAMFCKKNKKYLDYMLKVLFPEVLIKIYMDVFHVDHATAENEMTNAVHESDSQLGLNLTDSIFSV